VGKRAQMLVSEEAIGAMCAALSDDAFYE
jgi:hypothetical protein